MTTDDTLDTPEKIVAYWLSNMENALAYFEMQTDLPLDFTPASLAALEAWLLERYGSSAELLAEGEADYLDGAARYLGETFRQQLGGRWEIPLDDPKNAHYGLPRLTALADGGPPFCPQIELTTATARRTGTYLSTRFASRRPKQG